MTCDHDWLAFDDDLPDICRECGRERSRVEGGESGA